jgi:hypothetical protein
MSISKNAIALAFSVPKVPHAKPLLGEGVGDPALSAREWRLPPLKKAYRNPEVRHVTLRPVKPDELVVRQNRHGERRHQDRHKQDCKAFPLLAFPAES